MTSLANLLTLPDEILFQIIKHYLAVPKPTPRLVVSGPCSGDPAVLKLTCKRLNLLAHDVEKGKKGQMTLLISSPQDRHRLLLPRSERVQRLIFTDMADDDREQGDKLRSSWQQSLPALLNDLVKRLGSAQQGGPPFLPLLKRVEIWPDTPLGLASTARAANAAQPTPDSQTAIPSGQSLASTLYDGLTPLCRLLNLSLTIHSLNGVPDLHISHMPPILRIITPLKDLPVFSPQMPIEAVSQREQWTLLISPSLTIHEIVKRTIGFLHGMDRRMIVINSVPGPAYSARVCLEYDPAVMAMDERQELVHLIRQGVIGLAGGYGVSTDLQGRVMITIG